VDVLGEWVENESCERFIYVLRQLVSPCVHYKSIAHTLALKS
jgi:hypothetical protein